MKAKKTLSVTLAAAMAAGLLVGQLEGLLLRPVRHQDRR